MVAAGTGNNATYHLWFAAGGYKMARWTYAVVVNPSTVGVGSWCCDTGLNPDRRRACCDLQLDTGVGAPPLLMFRAPEKVRFEIQATERAFSFQGQDWHLGRRTHLSKKEDTDCHCNSRKSQETRCGRNLFPKMHSMGRSVAIANRVVYHLTAKDAGQSDDCTTVRR